MFFVSVMWVLNIGFDVEEVVVDVLKKLVWRRYELYGMYLDDDVNSDVFSVCLECFYSFWNGSIFIYMR